jgi:soluble lytic murein transglycosylase-like protein
MRLLFFILLFSLQVNASDYSGIVKRYSSKYGISEEMIHAVINVESGGNAKAKNKDGSYGLMQLQYGTAVVMGFKGSRVDLLKPEVNISLGVKYLRYLLDMFGSENMALDAYNRGWGNVKKYPYRGEWAKHRYVGLILKQRSN